MFGQIFTKVCQNHKYFSKPKKLERKTPKKCFTVVLFQQFGNVGGREGGGVRWLPITISNTLLYGENWIATSKKLSVVCAYVCVCVYIFLRLCVFCV